MSGSWASRCSSRLASRSVVCRSDCCGRGRFGRGLLACSALQVALDLELAQIADERTRFTGEALGLALKRADAIGDRAACGLGRRLGRCVTGAAQRSRHAATPTATAARRGREDVARNARIIRRGTRGRAGCRRAADWRGGERLDGHPGAPGRRAADVRPRRRCACERAVAEWRGSRRRRTASRRSWSGFRGVSTDRRTT